MIVEAVFFATADEFAHCFSGPYIRRRPVVEDENPEVKRKTHSILQGFQFTSTRWRTVVRCLQVQPTHWQLLVAQLLFCSNPRLVHNSACAPRLR